MEILRSRLIEGDYPSCGQGLPAEGLVATARGQVRVADLAPGDLVETLEGEHRPVVMASAILPDGSCDPGVVLVEPPALGATTEICLRGGQFILLSGWLIAALFSRPEVLARAASLQNGGAIRRCSGAPGRFFRIVLDRAAAVLCSGVPVITHSPDAGAPAALLRPLLNDYAHRVLAESGIFARRRAASRPDNALRLPVTAHG